MSLRDFITEAVWEGALARVNRERPVVVAVTGSVGKTSTKEAIAAVLQQTGRPVVKTYGNLNTEIGVPLSLLGYTEAPTSALGWLGVLLRSFTPPKTRGLHEGVRPYFVLEYSAERPGDISYLTNKLAPEVAVITCIVPVHLENYPDFAALRTEKLSLVAGLVSGGTALLNADDPEQAEPPVQPDHPYTTLQYGKGEDAKRQGTWVGGVSLHGAGLRCTIHHVPGKAFDGIGKQQPQTITLDTQALGEAQLQGMAAAAALGFREGLHGDQVKQALESLQQPPGRGRIIEGAREVTIIDESYNASPAAVREALQVLNRLGTTPKRRRVAVLGRMNELGDGALGFHQEVAAAVVGMADTAVFIGQYSEQMRESAVAAGMSPEQVTTFATTEDAIAQASQVIRKGDLVLVKGSQNGVRLERLVKRLMLHPKRAGTLLARQGRRWQ